MAEVLELRSSLLLCDDGHWPVSIPVGKYSPEAY